jgi:hypothetical protein
MAANVIIPMEDANPIRNIFHCLTHITFMLSPHVLTRSQRALLRIGCREWQLYYMILSYLFELQDDANHDYRQIALRCGSMIDKEHYQDTKHIVEQLFQKILSIKGKPLYSYLVLQELELIPPHTLLSVSSVYDLPCGDMIKNYAMCLVKNNIVKHYFIISCYQDAYYMNSSWLDEEYVFIQKNIKPIDAREFSDFCTHFKANTNQEFVRDFFRKYFLDESKGLTVYTDEDAEEPHIYLPPKRGILNLLNDFFKNAQAQTYDIMVFPSYEDEIRMYIPILNQPRQKKPKHGGKRKTMRKCKNRKRTRRH